MSLEDGRVVSNFVVQALRERPITVYGDGSQTRSFFYVADLVAGLWTLMDAPDLSGPVNLVHPNEIPVLELAEIIRDKIGPESEIVFNSLPPFSGSLTFLWRATNLDGSPASASPKALSRRSHTSMSVSPRRSSRNPEETRLSIP